MARWSVPTPIEEPEKWLAVAAALVALGVLPKRWEKMVALAGALVYLVK
jgi:RsiW-degrading membrane proteinase PrsW (M82 family)